MQAIARVQQKKAWTQALEGPLPCKPLKARHSSQTTAPTSPVYGLILKPPNESCPSSRHRSSIWLESVACVSKFARGWWMGMKALEAEGFLVLQHPAKRAQCSSLQPSRAMGCMAGLNCGPSRRTLMEIRSARDDFGSNKILIALAYFSTPGLLQHWRAGQFRRVDLPRAESKSTRDSSSWEYATPTANCGGRVDEEAVISKEARSQVACWSGRWCSSMIRCV